MNNYRTKVHRIFKAASIWAGIFFCIQSALSFDSLPEYWGFQEEEIGLLGRTAWIDNEYTSDVLTYTLPSSWDYYFWSANQAFDASIGSLGAKHFMIRRRLKVQHDIAKKWQFKLFYFDHSDYDDDQKHLVVEFDYWSSPKIGWAIYSELTYKKKSDDIGLAFLYKPSKDHIVRTFYTSTDFSRNERNENDDYFETSPISYGIVGRKMAPNNEGQEFLVYGFRWEPEMELIYPSKNSRYKLARNYVFYQQRWGNSEGYYYIGADLKETKEFHLQDRNFSRGAITLQKGISSSHCLWQESCRYFGGIKLSQRKWEINSESVSHLDTIPHGGLRYKPDPLTTLEFSWDLVYHSATGNMSLRSTSDENDAIEARFNFGYQWDFNKDCTFKLLFTADLDRFSWEGGNGQFRLAF